MAGVTSAYLLYFTYLKSLEEQTNIAFTNMKFEDITTDNAQMVESVVMYNKDEFLCMQWKETKITFYENIKDKKEELNGLNDNNGLCFYGSSEIIIDIHGREFNLGFENLIVNDPKYRFVKNPKIVYASSKTKMAYLVFTKEELKSEKARQAFWSNKKEKLKHIN